MIKLSKVKDLKEKIRLLNDFYTECPIMQCKMRTPVRLRLQKKNTEGMENTYIAQEIVDKAAMQTWCQTKQNNGEPGNSPLTREIIVEYVEDTEGAALMQELYQGLENALESSTSEEIQCWIDSGGKINEDLLSGETLLFRAGAGGHVEVVKALLAAGAFPTDSIIAEAKDNIEIQSAISEARIIFDLAKDWIEKKISKLSFSQKCAEPSTRVVEEYYKSLMLHQAVLLNAFKKNQGMMIEQRKKLIEKLSGLDANETRAIENCLNSTSNFTPSASASLNICSSQMFIPPVQLTSNLDNSSSNNTAQQNSEAPNIARPTKRLKTTSIKNKAEYSPHSSN